MSKELRKQIASNIKNSGVKEGQSIRVGNIRAKLEKNDISLVPENSKRKSAKKMKKDFDSESLMAISLSLINNAFEIVNDTPGQKVVMSVNTNVERIKFSCPCCKIDFGILVENGDTIECTDINSYLENDKAPLSVDCYCGYKIEITDEQEKCHFPKTRERLLSQFDDEDDEEDWEY